MCDVNNAMYFKIISKILKIQNIYDYRVTRARNKLYYNKQLQKYFQNVIFIIEKFYSIAG